MPTITSTVTSQLPSLNNLQSKSSSLSDYEKKMRDTSHIVAKEFLIRLEKGNKNVEQTRLRLEMKLNNTTDRLERLQIKNHLICYNHATEFFETLTRRIKRNPDYCHAIYNKYQKFLDSHTRLQCISIYDALQDPGLVNEFSMSYIRFDKKLVREAHAEVLNILSLGNNRRTLKRF